MLSYEIVTDCDQCHKSTPPLGPRLAVRSGGTWYMCFYSDANVPPSANGARSCAGWNLTGFELGVGLTGG